MPLFKRQQKEEGRDKDKESKEGKLPKKEGEEGEGAPDEEVSDDDFLSAAEAEQGGALGLDDEEDEEGDDELSIDELIEDAEGTAHDAPGMAPPPIERDAGLDELAGEDVHLIKMAKKVVVVGDPAVGKTSLIKRYVQDEFDDRYLNTIGAKVMKKSLGVKKPETGDLVDLKLILWDIAGQETFNNVKKAYYRGASGAIVVCDVTRRDTMEDMHRWIENLFDVSDVIPMVIILNKTDLEEETQFSNEEVIDDYAPYGAAVFTASAKTGENVEMVFHELGKLISN
jgi:small GTP-binding protein